MKNSQLEKLLEQDDIKVTKELEKLKNSTKVLMVKPANTWTEEASKRPMPKELFSSLWFEGEICILFADTNAGKSILAVQIANAISKGEAVFDLGEKPPLKKVVYLDFELSDKQFQIRYSNQLGENYDFSSEFYRSEFDIQSLDDNQKLEDIVLADMEKIIKLHEVKIIIIDNITYLKAEMEKSKNALPLMKKLKALKEKYQLSILILAHTPKRDLSRPITNNDVAGSKMLINFCDSAFSIGRSSEDASMRYIKQIKVRNAEEKYGATNVAVCLIEKENCFLHFKFLGFDEETNHLKDQNNIPDDDIEFQEQIKELTSKNPKISNREIARQLKTNHQKVGRHIDKMKQSGTLV
ncbi:MAG: AAA family ATPase [Putridiphycobacter sp.]|nr:AAA family ATPase [Putridiphycobacter sp.]